MLKVQTFLIVVFISCSVFVSCERGQRMASPVLPAEPPLVSSDVVEMPDMDDSLLPGPSVVINELMADNDNTFADPQGDYDDWVELHNLTESAVTLTGMYLSDKEDDPTKWAFPENTEIPAKGYLIVYLDDDEDAADGLHATFKLSKDGEAVLLVDTDVRGNQVLDSIVFEAQQTDVSFGRWPNGTGEFQIVPATPGAENMTK